MYVREGYTSTCIYALRDTPAYFLDIENGFINTSFFVDNFCNEWILNLKQMRMPYVGVNYIVVYERINTSLSCVKYRKI